MQGYLAFGSLICMLILIGLRIRQLAALGITAFKFGRQDKKDFIAVPFVLLLFYEVGGHVFGWPTPGGSLFETTLTKSMGAVCCVTAALLVALTLRAFGRSFRVGIDQDQPGQLVTSGIFAYSRNPIYVGMLLILLGFFLVFGDWLFLLYLAGAFWFIQRQIKREEAALLAIYGQEYLDYQAKVGRYI